MRRKIEFLYFSLVQQLPEKDLVRRTFTKKHKSLCERKGRGRHYLFSYFNSRLYRRRRVLPSGYKSLANAFVVQDLDEGEVFSVFIDH